MTQTSDFECLRCAFCCKNLLENKDNILRGLPLTETEVQLFPAEAVVPKVAVGSDKPQTIILYQLNLNCCPHIDAQNSCQIYAKRPLMCQSFPIVAGAISNRCKAFNYRKPGVTYNEPYTMTQQLQANSKLEKYTRRHLKKNSRRGLRIWEYDLESKKWISKGLVEK